MYNLWEQIKNWIMNLFKSRTVVLLLAFCLMAAILLQRVFVLQIVNGQEYLADYTLKIQKTREVKGTRGRILDRNGIVLADNRLAYSVTIEDNGDYENLKAKNKIINETIGRVIAIVESNGDEIISNFKIILNDNDEYEYTMGEGTSRLRFLAAVFGYATIDKLSEKQRNYTAEDMITYLCTNEKYGYGIDQNSMSKADVLKFVNIRYAMSLNRFQKYMATTIAHDVSAKTTAAIMENIDTLQGVNIGEDTLRVYNDGKYFASIIGYTGQISQAEYDNLSEDIKKSYSLTDIVGKSGLEQVMDEYLQGKKGEIKLYVNNVGRVIESVQTKESRAGNDLYTTIDANLQKVAYDLLEEKLAGILVENLHNVLVYDRSNISEGNDIIVAIGDVYNAFFSNGIFDQSHFEKKDAGVTESAVYERFLGEKESILSGLYSQLSDVDAVAYKECSQEYQAYYSYIIATLLTTDTNVLLKDKIDKNDEVYLQWENDESISMRTYLNHCIAKGWIDTSLLKNYVKEEGAYSDLNQTYEGLIDFIVAKLSVDSDFDNLIYKYMIREGKITGREICMMIYEQGILKYDESQYNRLSSGSMTAYDFIRAKIQNLELTPGQLGLEPCTGSVVVTDCNTGDVLACVSYPGYDNNRLANTMDSAYYRKLLNDQATPLYNAATQEKTAPGSTYKPLVAVAGLTEGVINTETENSCDGVYDKIFPTAKCWIYPRSHGSLNTAEAIQHSCNEFFYEVGYRLGLTGEYITNSENGNSTEVRSDAQGLEALQTYAGLFGLNEKSGIQIPEAEPQISNEDAVRSSIGQGTNNYTTTQLARYIAAVANRGTVLNLNLLDKVVDIKGKTVVEYETSVNKEITNISNSTWNSVHQGMRNVVANSATYRSLGEFEMSGKTGTAQQSTKHANHGLFVGFAPSADPEVAFAIRIKNGYESAYVAQIGRDLMRYYYGLAEYGNLITGQASDLTGTTRTD